MTTADVHPKADYGDSTSGDDENYVEEEEKDWSTDTAQRSERKGHLSRPKFSTTAYTRVFKKV